jgi:hypothetical protein
MRTVILRDDDTNALTPVACLETLYRPFLERGLPINLATIPEVRVNARTPQGAPEGFVRRVPRSAIETVPLRENPGLVDYLHSNPGYAVVQHGCHHDTFEFDRTDRTEVVRRLERGAEQLRAAGFEGGRTFVAPHDKISAVAYAEIARRFDVISTGWFEWHRLPRAWRSRYLLRKLLRRPHWQVDSTLLLSHPGCLLSYARPLDSMLETIRRTIDRQEVTVLVTHWWEYFRDGKTDERFVRVLHALADQLAERRDLRVTTFATLARETNRRARVATESSLSSTAV